MNGLPDAPVEIPIADLNEERLCADRLADLDISGLDLGRFGVHHDGGRFDFVLKRQEGARLFVHFTGAIDRERHKLPQFRRWRWANDYPGNVLYVSDPTLRVDPDLRLAWYLGHQDGDWAEG